MTWWHIVSIMHYFSPVFSASPLFFAIDGFAQSPDLHDRLAACATCHGQHGEGNRGAEYYPHLAGKLAGYLFDQLQGFRDGCRMYPLRIAWRTSPANFPSKISSQSRRGWRSNPLLMRAARPRNPSCGIAVYLVNAPEHCAFCHSTRDALASLPPRGYLAGGVIPAQGWYAPVMDDTSLTRLSIDGLAEFYARGHPLTAQPTDRWPRSC